MDLKIEFNEPRRICCHCNKTLPPINSSRKNGKQHRHDWDERQYHKICYKKIKQIEESNRMFESLGMTQRITKNEDGTYSMKDKLINTWVLKHGNADGFEWIYEEEQ